MDSGFMSQLIGRLLREMLRFAPSGTPTEWCTKCRIGCHDFC